MKNFRKVLYWLSFIGIFAVMVIAAVLYFQNIDQTHMRFIVDHWYLSALVIVFGFIAALNKEYA